MTTRQQLTIVIPTSVVTFLVIWDLSVLQMLWMLLLFLALVVLFVGGILYACNGCQPECEHEKDGDPKCGEATER